MVDSGELIGDFGTGFCKVVWKSDSLTPNLGDRGAEKIRRAIDLTMQRFAPEVESYAKINAPWTDQTGNARNGLAARAGRDGAAHYIALFHQVPYGIYLEVRWSGRYAIIMPTLEHYAPEVMAGINGLLGKDIFK